MTPERAAIERLFWICRRLVETTEVRLGLGQEGIRDVGTWLGEIEAALGPRPSGGNRPS